MSNTDSYYPRTIDGRAHWWTNINDVADNLLTGLNYTQAQITAILNDAAWANFCYGTIHRYFQTASDALTAFENQVLNSPNGAPMPTLPTVPALPAPPAAAILAGIEARRILWVQALKKNAGYNLSIGTQMGTETAATPFDPASYACQLLNLASNAPHTVGGKFRKAGGHVDGINFYGRKAGATAWTNLGRFNATPFTASVPLTTGAPESWEFYAMAVKADVEFGHGSPIFPVIVRP